jgi:hypothetical protein
MVVIVNNVTAKNEAGSEEVVVQAAKGIERDIEDLLRCASYNFYYKTIAELLRQHSEGHQHRID